MTPRCPTARCVCKGGDSVYPKRKIGAYCHAVILISDLLTHSLCRSAHGLKECIEGHELPLAKERTPIRDPVEMNPDDVRADFRGNGLLGFPHVPQGCPL